MMYATLDQLPKTMTTQEAADYLEISRRTVYRYIRTGRLKAARVGRTYRISLTDLNLMLWEKRSAFGFQLREYTDQEIEEFMRADKLDEETLKIAETFLEQHGLLIN